MQSSNSQIQITIAIWSRSLHFGFSYKYMCDQVTLSLDGTYINTILIFILFTHLKVF